MRKTFSYIFSAVLALIIIAVVAVGALPPAPDVPLKGGHGIAGDPTAPTQPDKRGTGQVLTVNAGESIQAALDKAQPGDTVRVMPGTYNETLRVDKDSLTLEGVIEGDQRPVLDGQNKEANGVLGVADYFTISGFRVVNYTSNGVIVQGTTGVIMRNMVTDNTGEYGLFPILSTDILIEKSFTAGVIDTGIYVGQSKGIIVRDNEATRNVSGIEIENSVDALVENNYCHDNTGGMLIFLLPGKTAAEGRHTIVRGNRFENNNHVNFARPEMTVALVPPGTGLLILSADESEVVGNIFKDNKSYAIGLVALTDFPDYFPSDGTGWDIPVIPENNWVHSNVYEHNGYDPDKGVLDAGFKGRDLLWSTAGYGNRWDEVSATRFPDALPSSNWPGFIQRFYTRVLQFLVPYL